MWDLRLTIANFNGINVCSAEPTQMKVFSPMCLAIISALSCGCGTISTFIEREPTAYGGVKKDIEWFEQYMNGASLPVYNMSGDAWGAAMIAGLVVAEPAMSFVADTATLPVTIYLDRKRREQ